MYTKISEPYLLSKWEADIVKNHFRFHKDWDKVTFESIKKNIIKHLRVKQDNQCCYCRGVLGFDIKEVDIEHVIPKSKYPAFTFHAKNLALSCPGCNTSKGTKNVLRKEIKYYPRTGSNITIIHPHFDDYFVSINIHEGVIFEGRDDKGCETIKLCKLYRLKDVLEKKKKISTSVSPIQKLIEDIRNADESEKNQLLEEIQALTSDCGVNSIN
ncbi:TIGR02646 family protein [Marinobacter persicus]|uniref:TIGR02646 family protein n=1 Tax=Marinobacter persicus TaxID=930118 RepID=A0A1I3U3F2_9GAMM|nr:HNH endonuclease [Marinobacter persicus]GHD45459.1 hypothetical protein GCM10008110_11230 [Marinobacter persicus]SFJ76327.1 TIGR02646 family protein [Marinobacter persicus]